MSFFSSIKNAVKKIGSAHVKVATAPLRVTRRATKAVARVSPAAVVVRRLRSAAARAPITPFAKAKADGWQAPTSWRGGATAAAYGGGGGGGGPQRYSEEYDGDDELPVVPSPVEDDEDDDGQMAGADVYARHFGQLAGWTDDLKKIGVDLAKGAASGALTTVARGLSPTVSPRLPPPPPPGMSSTAKIAIGVAIGVPVIYLLTRRRGSSTPVAA